MAGGITTYSRGVLLFLTAIPPDIQAREVTAANTEVYLVEQYLKAFLQFYHLA